MNRIFKIIVSVILAVLMACLLPAQVFADTPDYISEIKIGMGKTEDEAKAALKGYVILDTNLNKDAGGGTGSKGEKAVYLGYKTTSDKKDAITDLALMNMKGGYNPVDYDTLMDKQMNSQIIPFVRDFLDAINEYRDNYASNNKKNNQRAQYIHDALNKLTDDDCGGQGLGDLLLNETKFEMGDEAYNKLSEEEKKNHADILTIVAQSNGQATLLFENLITRACDTSSKSWVDRFVETTYDDMIISTGLSPTDARKKLAKEYDDDAEKILEMWDTFREQLLNSESSKKTLDTIKTDKLEDAVENVEDVDVTDIVGEPESEEAIDFADAWGDVEANVEIVSNCINDFIAAEYLKNVDYNESTLYEFFTQSKDDIDADITVLYPLVASLSKGQRAGLDFVSLSELVSVAGTDAGHYKDAEIDKKVTASIYSGVDRAIYKKGGVALTSDLLRLKANDLIETPDGTSALSILSIISITLGAISAAAFLGTVGVKISAVYNIKKWTELARQFKYYGDEMTNVLNRANTEMSRALFAGEVTLPQYKFFVESMFRQKDTVVRGYVREWYAAQDKIARYSARSSFCNKLMIGLGVAAVILTAISIILQYQDMVNHYKTEFTPIPRYMIDEKDLIGYNSKGEKVILKNQEAYYKAAECNRTGDDEKYKEIGTYADLNGDVGKQWLALYYVKNNDIVEPILASSLTAVVNSTDVPSGYNTGVHMFGSNAAFNLNSASYVWNNTAKSVYIYFKNGEAKNAKTNATGFTNGMVVLIGGVGFVAGVVFCIFTVKIKRKKVAEATTQTM